MGFFAWGSSTVCARGILRLIAAAFRLPDRRRRAILIVGITPERVDENPNRSAGRAHVFNLAARQPVIDGPPADTDELARFHDRDGFAFHWFLASRAMVSVANRAQIRPVPEWNTANYLARAIVHL